MKRSSTDNFVRLHSLWIESRDLRLSKGPLPCSISTTPAACPRLCPHLPLCTSATFSHSCAHQTQSLSVQELELGSQSHRPHFLTPLGCLQKCHLGELLIPNPSHYRSSVLPLGGHPSLFSQHSHLHLECCRELKRHGVSVVFIYCSVHRV